MKRKIVLPPHLYDRIKASAGEHGGIGVGECFTIDGFPLCAHGHAWGTFERYDAAPSVEEPELKPYLSFDENDSAVDPVLDYLDGKRLPFDQWCKLLNVKRGVAPVVASVVDCELAVD